MADRLLEYVFKVNVQPVIPSANLSYLRNVIAIVKPLNDDIAQEIVLITNQTQIATYTANAEVAELFNAGMQQVYLLPSDDLEISDLLSAKANDAFTVLVSSDFSKSEMDAYDFASSWKGVIAYGFSTADDAAAYLPIENFSAWIQSDISNKSKNMFYVFGKLLSDTSWNNQQYIQVPYNDLITDEAEFFFQQRLSFVLFSEEFGNRLAFFVAGGKAIIAPYIYEQLSIRLQSTALTYINLNRPQYTVVDAALLEGALQEVINNEFIELGLLENGTITITLTSDNFMATGEARVPPPTAYWRTITTLIQGA